MSCFGFLFSFIEFNNLGFNIVLMRVSRGDIKIFYSCCGIGIFELEEMLGYSSVIGFWRFFVWGC